jgi:hypothetical protein
VVIPSFGEFPGGKGRRSNDVRRPARGEAKSFYLEKVFSEVHFTPCGATRRCYEQPSASERPSDGLPDLQRGGTRPTRRTAGASLALAGLLASSEKRRRHRRLQADLTSDGWKPEGGDGVPAPCAARQPGPKGTPRHHAGTMFTAENPAGRKGEEGKPPSGLCNRGREEKEWPVSLAPAFRSVRLLPRGADRGHHHQQKGGAPSSVYRLRKVSALNAQLFTPRSVNSPCNGSVSFSSFTIGQGRPARLGCYWYIGQRVDVTRYQNGVYISR